MENATILTCRMETATKYGRQINGMENATLSDLPSMESATCITVSIVSMDE